MVFRKGSRGAVVKKIQEGLAHVGFHPGPIDGVFGGATESAVEDFQARVRLMSDGLVGPATMAALKKAVGGEFSRLETPDPPSSPVLTVAGERLKWVRCPAEKFEGRSGYTRTTLREDVAEAYNALHDEVLALGGIITSAGGRRGLSAKASPSRSRKSMHYKPKLDPYVVQLDLAGNGRQWIVWCKTENPEVPLIKVDASYVTRHKNSRGKSYTALRSTPVMCRAFNFTALAAKHGFQRISARRSFMKGGSYGGAEWWHFQWEQGLVPNKTTFGSELLRCYPIEDAEKFVYWGESKNCKWKDDWF